MSLTVVGTVVAGLMASSIGKWLDSPAQALDSKAYGKLALWPGINTAFLISVGVIVIGAFVARLIPTQPWRNPIKISGENIFQYLYDGLITTAKRITRVTQSGSLLAYNAVIVLVIISVLAAALLAGTDSGFTELTFADSFFQFIVVLLACAFTFGIAFTQQRFVAALRLGGLGLDLVTDTGGFGKSREAAKSSPNSRLEIKGMVSSRHPGRLQSTAPAPAPSGPYRGIHAKPVQ
jgi:hypothetical protein